MNDDNILVSIQCLVYNHEPYLRQCLDGFVMQKTNFRFEAIVHDDASTDGSAAIIREYSEKYPDIIKPIYEAENQYSKHGGFSALFDILNSACKGKYIAMCEGDDYWIDPMKLQKQVDFLESHPDYVYSCHRYEIYNEQTGELALARNKYFDKHSKATDFTFGLKYAFHKEWVTKTLTCVYRNEAFDHSVMRKYKYGRDVHLIYFLLSKGKGVCHSFIGGVYRKNISSTYGSLPAINQVNISEAVYKELYDVTHDVLFKECLASLYIQKIIVGRKFVCPRSYIDWYALLIYFPRKTLQKCIGFLTC